MASAIQPDGTQAIITEDGVTTPEPTTRILTPMRRMAAAALGFTALLVSGVILLVPSWDAAEEIESWYRDSGNTTRQVVGMFLFAVAGLAFIWFIVELRDRFRVAGERRYSLMAMVTGSVFVATLAVAGAALAAVAGVTTMSDAGASIAANTDLLRAFESLGYGVFLVFGCLAVALCIFAISRAGQRTGLFPVGVAVVGYLAAAVLLFSIFWIPVVALPVWSLTVGTWGLATNRA